MKKDSQKSKPSPVNIIVVVVFLIGIFIAISMGVLGFLQPGKADVTPNFNAVTRGTVDSATLDEDADKLVKTIDDMVSFAPKTAFDALNTKVLLPAIKAQYGKDATLDNASDIAWDVVGTASDITSVKAIYTYANNDKIMLDTLKATGTFTVRDLLLEDITLTTSEITTVATTNVADIETNATITAKLATKLGITVGEGESLAVDTNQSVQYNIKNITSFDVLYNTHRDYMGYLLNNRLKANIIDTTLGTSFVDDNTSKFVWSNPEIVDGKLVSILVSYNVQLSSDNLRKVVDKVTFTNPITPKDLLDGKVHPLVITNVSKIYTKQAVGNNYKNVAKAIVTTLGGTIKDSDEVYTSVATGEADKLIFKIAVCNDQSIKTYNMTIDRVRDNTSTMIDNINAGKYENASTEDVLTYAKPISVFNNTDVGVNARLICLYKIDAKYITGVSVLVVDSTNLIEVIDNNAIYHIENMNGKFDKPNTLNATLEDVPFRVG